MHVDQRDFRLARLQARLKALRGVVTAHAPTQNDNLFHGLVFLTLL